MKPAALAQFADAITFAACVMAFGIAGEANPVMSTIGASGALLVKAAAIAVLPVVLTPGAYLIVAVAGCVWAGFNVAALVR